MNTFLAILLSAQVVFSHRTIVAPTPTVAGGGGPTYLLEENFEGPGYEQSWTESGTVDDQYQAVQLAGDYSCQVQASSYTKHDLGSGYSELWIYFMLQMEDLPGAAAYIARTRNSTDTATECHIQMDSSGRLYVAHPNTSPVTTDSMSTGVPYHVWIHIKNGTGDAVASVEFATSDTRVGSGNKYTQTPAGQTQTDPHQVFRLEVSASQQAVYDKVRVDDEDIGSSPD